MLQVPNRAVQALLDLADYFDRLDPGDYDQSNFHQCICGHCNKRANRIHSDMRAAGIELGLSYEQSARLFNGEAGKLRLSSFFGGTLLPGPKDAAACLRHIAVTGDLPDHW